MFSDPIRKISSSSWMSSSIGMILLVSLTGCAATTFNYKPSPPRGIVERKGAVQVGEFKNNMGFSEPNRVRFNVVLDRPVSQAFREAVIAELKQAGYSIETSQVTVSGSIESFGFEAPASPGLYQAQATFSISKDSTGRVLFSKTYSQNLEVSSIYDESGQIFSIQKLILQFINDPQAGYILTYGDLPPVQQVQASPTPGASPQSLMPPPSDVDRVPTRSIPLKNHAYAIVIGIEQYREKLPKADFADRDARLVGEYLTKVMGYPEENVVVRTNEKASLTDLIKYLETWLPNNAEKDGAVFIYYSGHGAPNPKTGDAYLVPYDGDPSFVDSTGYPLKRLYAALDKLPAKEVTVVLDSCFSGAGGRSVIAKGMRPMVISVENPALASGKTVVLAASSGDQVSSTYEEKGHGLLTYYFLKGLQGEGDGNKDGRITMSELFEYVKPQVQKVARKQYNNEQTPQLLASPDILRQGGGRLIDGDVKLLV
jgi:hypothetical protein